MGERAARLDDGDHEKDNKGPGASTRDVARQLEGDIAAAREELGALVAEIDRRRHEFVDVRLQLKRHAGGVALFAFALVATASGFVWLGMWRARRRERFLSTAGRVREAVARMVDRPEHVATVPTIPARILTSAATAAVATLVSKGLERIVRVVLDGSDNGSHARSSTLLGGARRPTSSANGPHRASGLLAERVGTELRRRPLD